MQENLGEIEGQMESCHCQALITTQSLCSSLQIGETVGSFLAVLSSLVLYRRSNGWEYADGLKFLFFFIRGC